MSWTHPFRDQRECGHRVGSEQHLPTLDMGVFAPLLIYEYSGVSRQTTEMKFDGTTYSFALFYYSIQQT